MEHEDVRIGTSGWHYQHWEDVFYPAGMPESGWLNFYSKNYNSVEINNTFYKLPEALTLRKWYDSVPDDFVFSVKANRYITHMKKLSGIDKNISKFLDSVSILDGKLGPILFQLPPGWKFNRQRLSSFLSCLSTDFRYVFEFRNETWFNDEAYELLSENHAALCIYDFGGVVSPRHMTTDMVYVRLHGAQGPYYGSYSDDVLAMWAKDVHVWSAKGLKVFFYFNNDQAANAVMDAKTLSSMVFGRKGE